MTWIATLVWIFFGIAAAIWAKERGRSPIIWFVIGTVFGIFGIIALFLLPSYIPGAQEERESLVPKEPQGEQTFFPTIDWFYMGSDKKPHGPQTLHQIKEMFQEKKLSSQSWVWHESIMDWKRIAQVSGMLEQLNVPPAE